MDKKNYILLFYGFISYIQLCYGFGFDSASSSCQRVSPRRGRAQLLKVIPCDLTSQTYCNLPGSSYPWHAVRKFVHENQGLMKRMYGNVHQISILKTEIHNNDIDMDELEFRPTSHFTRNNHLKDYNNNNNNDFINDSPKRKSRYLHSEFQNSRNNDILNEPYFRPTTTTANTKPDTSTINTITSSTETNTMKSTSDSIQNSLKDNIQLDENLQNIKKSHGKSDDDNNLFSNSIYETNTQNTNIQDNIKIIQSPNLNELQSKSNNGNESETSTISTTLHVIQSFIVKTNENSNVNKVKNNKLNISKEELMEKIQENLRNINETLIKKQNEQLSKGTFSTTSTEDAPIINKTTTPSSNKNLNNVNNNDKKKPIKMTTMEGQLYQDTIQKESVPVTSFRGVNACPIKEEVVAPFWANNTRGEILALLNLYPFEQYVHFQKCQSEKKQMYCRDGCRCEQQFSLHRLLAYDPHDECRGIFSDWFRFPSCCVCKCYNIPLEFRATSRSPRAQNNEYDDDMIMNIDQKDPIDIVRENVHRAIYEHATEDWYRGSKNSKDEFYDLNYD